jgi:hypothetical protein
MNITAEAIIENDLDNDLLQIDRILEPSDKPLLEEALKCYEFGALRSAYIMTWLCTAESLHTKIKHLALRDKDAGDRLSKIQEKEKNNAVTDVAILDASKALKLINEDEYKELRQIYDMRNSYAHPKHVAPLKPNVQSAMATSLSIVLSRPVLWTEGFILNQLDLVFNDAHYLADISQISKFAESMYAKIRPDKFPFVIQRAFL